MGAGEGDRGKISKLCRASVGYSMYQPTLHNVILDVFRRIPQVDLLRDRYLKLKVATGRSTSGLLITTWSCW
jgi:hypothetical protein